MRPLFFFFWKCFRNRGPERTRSSRFTEGYQDKDRETQEERSFRKCQHGVRLFFFHIETLLVAQSHVYSTARNPLWLCVTLSISPGGDLVACKILDLASGCEQTPPFLSPPACLSFLLTLVTVVPWMLGPTTCDGAPSRGT